MIKKSLSAAMNRESYPSLAFDRLQRFNKEDELKDEADQVPETRTDKQLRKWLLASRVNVPPSRFTLVSTEAPPSSPFTMKNCGTDLFFEQRMHLSPKGFVTAYAFMYHSELLFSLLFCDERTSMQRLTEDESASLLMGLQESPPIHSLLWSEIVDKPTGGHSVDLPGQAAPRGEYVEEAPWVLSLRGLSSNSPYFTPRVAVTEDLPGGFRVSRIVTPTGDLAAVALYSKGAFVAGVTLT